MLTVEGTAVKGVVFMNRIFKVIFNRNRQLVQVVPEYAKNRGKEVSESRKGGVRGLAKVLLTFLATLMIASPGYAADGNSTGSGDTTYISDTNTEAQNIQALDKQVVKNAQDIAASKSTTDTNKSDIAANRADIEANKTSIDSNKTKISKNTSDIATNTTNISENKTAIADNKTAIDKNASAISTNTQKIAANTTNIANNTTAITSNKTSIAANASDITDLKDLANITDAGKTVIKKQAKQAVKVAATGNATVSTTGSEDDDSTLIYTINVANNGAISVGDTNLVSGGTMYTELRPTGGTYVLAGNTTAANLLALDTNLVNVVNALGLDVNDTTKSYTSKLNKYFKVNPKITTSTDGTTTTTTYAPDAAANGTNAVAIGPSAQAGESTTDATTSTTTVTGGTSSTAVGDSAKANGNQAVALGYGSEVLNTTDQSGKTTATISGSTAIGNGAKVNGATDAAAVGTSAQVNETATGGIAFGKNAVTGEDKGTVTVGDVTANVAAVGGENSVALGTSAKASGNTALALGKGAQVNNYTTQSGTTVTKTVNSGSTAIGSGAVVTGANDAVAFGSGAKVEGTGTNADDSLALGKSASVATAKDAMALGTSASVASGADNAIALGNGAKANTSNTTAIGYNASATGAGAVAIGENTSTSTEGGISIGSGTSVSGKSIVIGYATDNAGNAVKTESNNTDAVAIGNGAQANANDSISIGHQAGKDTAEGRTSGYGSLIAIGTNAGNNVKGMQNVALGSGAGSNVKSSYNVAIGSNAGSGINYAAAADSNPQNGYNISIGYEANYQSADANAKNIKESIAIGHSANAVSEATALGTGAAASGDKSMALGYNATAADTDSIALGDNASAGGGNIAIGSGSQAPAVASYDKGYLTGSTSVNGYISVGGTTSATGTTVLRRISNVADGAADQDAVTVAQLKQAYTNLEGTIKTTDNKITDTYTQSAIDSKISTVERKITASQTKYFSINPSSDTLTANVNNDGASTTGAADAMAIGPNATATSAKAVAIGNNVSASGKGSIALGTADNPATSTTVAAGGNTSANPHVTSAEGVNSVAIGTSAIAQTDNSVALGTRASVYTSDMTDKTTGTTMKVGQQSIAIGYQAETRNSNATSIGSDAKAYSNGSTAIGHGAYAQGTDAIVLGTSSTANGASSGILGKSNTVNGSNTYTVGSENKVNGNWGAVTYSGLYGSKNIVNPVSDTSGNTKHGMDSLFITGNSNTIGQGSYSDTVQNISILGNSNSVTGASSDEANAGTTANITVIGGNNEVTGRDGAGSDYMGKTWNQLTRTSIIGYGNKVNQKEATTSLANTQILGNDVTATLGNSVYLGTGSAAKNANSPDTDTLVKAETDAANAVDTTGMTDDEKTTALSDAKAKARYAVKLAAMKANKGSTAGTEVLNTDTTYDDGTSYTYAGSSPVGVVTVGKAGSERRIQNVAAGLVSASSTDAVNGSQLYALTRQIRFGGDNSSFGTTTADDQNVVARGSNETLNIIGGEKDTTKLTDNNIGVLADSTNNTLTVKLASNLEDLNTAQLGSGSGDSYKETIKLDGTGTTGGQMTLAGADGTVKTTLDTTGLTIANGPKFTSSGIDAASQKINHVTAGTDDADAANVGQVNAAAAEATTEVKAGTNASLGTVETSAADKHKIYTVNVDNLAVKAANGNASVALANGINFKNGTNTTSAVDASGNVTIDTKNLTLEANGTNKASVSMDGGINFKNGTNTTATVDTDGTVTISATHNKLDSASYTASKPSDSSNQTTVKLKDTDGNETTLNLTDTYTTVSKNTDHTISFKRNDGSNPVSISLDDLDGASNEALTKAAAKATTTVIKGTNVDSVDDDTTSADGHHIYKVNVSNLGVKVADGQKKSVALSEGLVFGNGTNTTASVGDNGAITFNVSNDAIKTQAKDAINMSAGSNVKVETTSTDGLSKTFTISATHNALKSATLTPKSNDVSTLTITGNDGDTASVDIKNTHLTVTKDSEAKTVTFTSNDGTTPETTLSLSDLGAASTADMNAAKAAASTEVKAGTNASLGTVETNQTDQHKIYTVNVDNLGLKQNGTAAGTVTLADGINFADGTNTSATVSNGKVTFDLKKDITNIDTITASNSIQAGNVEVGKQGADNKNYVTGLENKNWTVGQTTYEAGRAATEDQLKSVSDKVASGFQVTDGTTSANIGADKKVTFTNGNYTTAKVTQATDGANVQYDINTAKLTTGANGTITAPTTDGVATAANVAEAINSAAWKIKANDNDTTAIKAGTTVGLKAGNNLTLSQSGTAFTYALKDELTGIKSLTTAAQDGVTTTLAASGVTIASSGTGNKSVSLTANGLNNGGKQITDVASGGDTDTNAANISDVKRLVQASASGTTETGFNVKGDDVTAKKVKLGKQLNVVGGTNDTSKLSDGNIGVVTKDDGQGNATLTVKLNKNINLDSVKAGNTTLDTNGLAISGGPTIAAGGINAGGKTITGVANGVGDNDAVNISQLKAVQSDINAGWTIKGKDTANADVSANIGKGKTVTYDNGNYTKSVVTKDDSTGNATVKVDVTTGTFGSGAGDKAGTVTSTAKGLATTQDVANAINSAAINVVADNTPDNKTSVKAGDTIHFAKDGNLTLVQNGTTFTYGLNSEISISKVTTSDATNGSTVQDAKGITTTDAAGNTYIQNGQGITLTSSDKTKSPVKLTNTGLNNGGNKITGVGKGTDDADAVNVAQLKEVNDKVGSGWQIAGNDGQKVADIGAGKKVSFKTGSQYLTANTESAGTDAANVTYGLKTKALTAVDGKVSAVDTAEDGLATAKNVAETINQTYWTAASGTFGSGSHTDETANPVDKQISAGDTVTFNAGNNLSLVQNGASFTYGLQANLTGMNTITFTPRNDADGHPISLVIGKQKDGVSNDEGYYITGLDNTSWNQSNYVKNRAATEAQLASAIQQVTLASQSGGFKLSDDNNNEVSQVLGQAIGVVGDSNITTTAETTTADPNGHIKVSLNKHIDLGTDGSLQAGGVTLKNNRVTVGNNGIVISSSDSERTVSNLSNTTWETAKVNQEASAGGYKGSTKAATESQLAEAISTATSTAAQNEQHIRNGEYSVQTINNGDGSKSQGVSIDIITGDGSKPEAVKGHVVIKDVAKASDLGNVSDLHDTLKNADGKKNVTGALNNLDDRVTGLDNRMDNIYTTAGQHSSVSSESNIVVDHSAKNESGGTDYKLSLNREKIDLDKVTIEGKSGAVTAKTVTAEEYKVGNKTYISSDGLNANSQKITNVQAGTADTDAANVGQVREADEQLAGGIAQNARNISQLGREVDKLDSRIDRVGAGAAALAALHPGAYDPNDKVDFSAGYGNYRGASAAAVGMYYHPDERTILSMGVAMGGGENMVNAGVTWKLGRRTPAAPQPVPVKAAPGTPALVPVSTAAAAPVRPVETAPAVRPVVVRTSVRPVETVALVAPAARVRPVQPAVAPVRTADTNAQLMELLARQTAILEKLSEQKAVPAAAPAASGDDLFTDVPENHWAYECALKMEKAGVLKGLGGLQVEGNPLLTRKDFARILYTALKNGATTNPALNSDNSLNRMASEFRGELKMVKG
ncbi:Hemagluttinin domain protein [Acidaminococcus fermentans DSM 20731]|uniref:Hemagluttinin domain protein n=3 Tax=Acidaminococcus fermentans TaxID=905 RepID=D2RP10_ACIFV|nr:Hemagluttinin domain protein [Acidaminococcus fermentans DSM 20731]